MRGTVLRSAGFLLAIVTLILGAPCGAHADGGATCAVAPTVNLPADVPYHDLGTTCGKTDNYDDVCSSYYGAGEDAIYILNVTAPGSWRFLFSGTEPFTGFFVSDDCPDGAAPACTGFAEGNAGNPAGTIAFASAGTYYLHIDTWPDPTCTAYALDIVDTAPNDTCAGAAGDPPHYGITVDSTFNDSTIGANDDYNNGGAPIGFGTCNFNNGSDAPDVVYYFDVSNDLGAIDLTLTPDNWDALLWVVTDCADPVGAVVGCSDTGSGGAAETLNLTGLADGRYYVICDGYLGESGPFQLTASNTDVPVELMLLSVE